jgi:predicted metalloprotease with PDZ domain
MGLKGMDTTKRRGAVAALIALSTTSALGAQVVTGATAGSIQVRRLDPRDSTEIRTVMVMSKARLDSLNALMREYNTTPRGTAEWDALKAKIDALLPRGQFNIRTEGMSAPVLPKGWIGINATGPHRTTVGADGYFVQYFDYPSIVSVDPDSPAQRAGIQPGDVLIGYDGIDVRGHRFDLTQMLVPEKKLAVSVKRDGEPKDYTLTILPAPVQVFDRRRDIGQIEVRLREQAGSQVAGELRADAATRSAALAAAAAGGVGRAGAVVPLRTWVFTANGAFGANMSTVSADLAKTLKIDQGVLITDVSDETPAARNGLRTGDVIVMASGQPVTTLKQLQELVMARSMSGDRSVPLVVVRDKRQQKLTINW